MLAAAAVIRTTCQVCNGPLGRARRNVCKPCGWEPTVGPQLDFLSSGAFEGLYGGAAGGGKSEALLFGALRGVGLPTYRAILFRRSFPELKKSLIDRSRRPYKSIGGTYNETDHMWRFPSGALIYFGHLEHEKTVEDHQSSEYQWIGFDELTHFTEHQYTYMLSRLRGAERVYARSGSNPGGVGHEWVFKRWGAWLNRKPDYKGIQADSGTTLHYHNVNGVEAYRDRGIHTLSRLFVRALIEDNPHVTEGSPLYVEQLKGLDAVNRARLLYGDWLAQPGAGKYYQRAWFAWLDVAPARTAVTVRKWDLASTEDGGDWTVGVKMSLLHDRTVVVEDVVRVRQRPGGVEKTVLATAHADGKGVRVLLSQDPGQAGVAQMSSYSKLLAGYVVKFDRETGDKVTRQEPFSAQVEAGNVALVKGAWNAAYLECLEGFPDGAYDDDVDASAGAYAHVVERLPNLTYLKAMERIAAEMKK